MDKELDQYFEGYDMDEAQNKQEYQEQARIVSEKFEDKLRRVGKNLRFAQDLIALFAYFMDAHVGWQRKVVIVAALLYFISPIDAIPDLAPFVGYLDDFGVITAVTAFMATELKPYYLEVETPSGSPEEN